MSDATLTLVYVCALLASGLVAVAVGIWAYRTSDGPDGRRFLGLMTVDLCWTSIAAAELLVAGPAATRLLATGRVLISIVAIGVWYWFTVRYTGRQFRRWRHAAVLAPLALLGLFGTGSPLSLINSGFVYRSDPLSFMEVTHGTLGGLGMLWVSVVILLSLYYLGELFVKSRHRASSSLLVVIIASLAAAIPFAASAAGLTPVPSYDHTVFGVAFFAAGTGYAVFGMGMFDIRPVARDALVDNVDDALLVLDEDGRLVDYNAASESLSERLAHGDPIGDPISEVWPDLTPAFVLPDDDETATTQVITTRRDGTRIHYRGRVTPLLENDDVVGYSVILRDVTTQVEYRRELEQRNEQLDQFASAVAHDLRNPLQVAMGRTHLLAEGLSASDALEPDSAESLAQIQGALDRMDDIITDLRTLAEKGRAVTDPEHVDFAAAVRAAWDTVGTDAGSLTVVADGTIEAERSRLLSILENLLRNVVDHAGPSPTIDVGLTADGFYVADDGPGIPPEDREMVFTYGVTGSEDGTGLGLAITQTMVTAHGWEIEATESDVGGARFVVTGAITDRSASAEAPAPTD